MIHMLHFCEFPVIRDYATFCIICMLHFSKFPSIRDIEHFVRCAHCTAMGILLSDKWNILHDTHAGLCIYYL
jgi:hypothetical protein